MQHRDLPNLDLLRSIAVISVVAEHTLLAMRVFWIGSWRIAWIGVIGVFMFFVHTALVLMWSLERRPDTLGFYIRRIFRIYPLTIVAILLAVLLHAPLEGTPQAMFHYVPPTPRSLVAVLLLVQNLFAGRNYISVLWSLPYEVQMYILLPVLFFFVRKNRALWPLLLFWGLAVAFCRTQFSHDGHNLATVIPYFLPGIMAYVGFDLYLPRFPAWAFPVYLLALTAAFMHHPNFFRAWFLCLFLGLGLPFFNQIRSHTLKQVSFYIAQYSFGLYLVHPFSIALGFYLLAGRPLAVSLAAELLTLIPVSIASYYWIERPMMRLGSRLAARIERRSELAAPGSHVALP